MELFGKHWRIMLQLLILVSGLILGESLAGILPGFWGFFLHGLIIAGLLLILGMVAVFLLLQIIQNFRTERSFVPENLLIRPLPALKKYRIQNPLEGPGVFHKAQLHTHSRLSYDSKVPPEQIIESYRKDGYDILAITDHDRLSDFSSLSTNKMLILPGVEETVPVLFWPIPLGKHLVIINPLDKRTHTGTVQQRLDQAANGDSLVIPAHLSWRGGAGTGRWFPEELYRLRNLQFIEINSPHSKDPLDITIWHKLIIKGGPDHPVWGLAVDDGHAGSDLLGWIMVKMTGLSLANLVASLKKGAFFATTGPLALDIKVEDTKILVSSPGVKWIRFFNAQNQVILASRADQAIYQSFGDEGFIRVEATDEKGHTAWSQPMWLAPE